MTEPASTFTVNTTPYTQTFGLSPRYAGRWVLVGWQWGFIAVNTDNPGTQVKKNGVWNNEPGTMAGKIAVEGDCHQSFAQHDITSDWVVAPNQSAPQCHRIPSGDVEGLQVWGGAPIFGWKGLIAARVRGNNQTRIVGDFAYVRNGSRDEWFVFDLLSMTVAPDLIPTGAVPPWSPQPNIDGFTYKLTPIHPVPPPIPYLGPKQLRFDREGASIMLNFYPLEDVKRQQDCAIMWNTLKWLKAHNPTLVIPPTVLTPQQFADVPPTHQFYESINSLGAAGIVVGRP